MPNNINRRGFIKTTAAAGTLAMAGGLARAAEKKATTPKLGANERINTAIIGIRSQGRNHIAYQTATPGVQIVTLCDIDENLFADRVKLVPGGKPKIETDMRRVFDDKDVDCVVIAMPNHWHALATIWACQAGKDVYVEKPTTYCISEGPKMMAAAKKYNRVVQNGTHLRMQTGREEGIKKLREGLIGDIYMARAFIYNPRKGIGNKADCPAPKGVNYDGWQGPARVRPFNPNRFHYEWHWNWEYGNGEIGNNGPHMNDLLIQGLDKQEILPVKISSHGGRFVWNDQGETPNVQTTNYTYGDGTVATLEISNLHITKEMGTSEGVIFYGSKGHMVINLRGEYQTVIGGKPGPKGAGGGAHRELARNFYDVVKSRKTEDLKAPLKYGHTGAALCHLGNIAYRLGQTIDFDPKTETCPGNDAANALLTRKYRKPYSMPKEV
ncbi:MAG: Gfo/Idh/MocA family oxidoreductase [Pirellulales bacterium]|nr:Gfo/Idh/MocA family oxidoreductase [Pirellulales bacterium]